MIRMMEETIYKHEIHNVAAAAALIESNLKRLRNL